jgi:VIT1/CCC1 family predicted Fe2+/Mn2+ transporter
VTRTPTASELRRWRRYLAAERAEAAVYRDLASRRVGEEREILLALADAEGRHEDHWLELLGAEAGEATRSDVRTRLLGFLARRFGSVFVLALAQRAESRSPYDTDADATDAMAADERIHEEVVRALAARGRQRLSGTFRAAVFGANDGLVSNLALVVGVTAAGLDQHAVLLTGVAGLLAGALSMGAGEYVSVRSQRELLDASRPGTGAGASVPDLDVDANELALVYRARGMSARRAEARAAEVLAGRVPAPIAPVEHPDTVGSAFGAAAFSFAFFASGALIPVIPYLFGVHGLTAVIVSGVLVGLALLGTGSIVGLLSGASPLKRALRQLAIGFGAAAATYGLGWLFGVAAG